MDDIRNAYSRPIGVFTGARRRQRGGGFFGRIAKMALPLLKSIGLSVGKHAVTMANNTLNDVSKGKSWRESIKRHGKDSLINASLDVLNKHTPKRKRNIFN